MTVLEISNALWQYHLLNTYPCFLTKFITKIDTKYKSRCYSGAYTRAIVCNSAAISISGEIRQTPRLFAVDRYGCFPVALETIYRPGDSRDPV